MPRTPPPADSRDVARVGYVYILHFHRRYKHAGHYVEFAETDVEARLVRHLAGAGSRYLRKMQDFGVTWTLVRLFAGTRADERRLKNVGGATRYCPTCSAKPWNPRWMCEVAIEPETPSLTTLTAEVS